MLDNSELTVSHETPVERLSEYGIRKHQEFDRDVWRQKSYHNEHHVRANIEVAENIIISAKKDPEKDVFSLNKQLAQWNRKQQEQNPDYQDLSLEEFEEAVVIAFSLHDLGNIGRWSEEEKRFKLFEQGYQSKKAEERSIEIAQQVMEEYEVDEGYRDLVVHLIGETKLRWGEGEPNVFGRFIRSCDQLSTNLQPDLEKRKKQLIGLVKEFGFEQGDDFGMEVDIVVNWAHYNANELLPPGVSLEEFAELAGYDSVPPQYENGWDYPLTTQAVIELIKEILKPKEV
jgi:hypothetical protein